jgi:hypothetical protein
MITARAYDLHVDQLFDKLRRIHAALDAAGIPYRVIGGVGIFLQITERDPNLARMTPDLDLAIHRRDLARTIAAAEAAGFQYGAETLTDPSNRGSLIHLVFTIQLSEPDRTAEGYLIAPVPDLVRMKLTSFRLEDKVHIQDMDGAGLITPEIEQSLPNALRERLQEVRETR